MMRTHIDRQVDRLLAEIEQDFFDNLLAAADARHEVDRDRDRAMLRRPRTFQTHSLRGHGYVRG